VPCPRTTALSADEVEEVVAIISKGRSERRPETLPERLQTRDWGSVVAVFLALEDRAPGRRAGWKIGAAADEIRRAEGVPSPSPGRIYGHTVFTSPAELPSGLFINYRNCECEFAFELGVDFPARDKPYTEADAGAGIEAMYPALELGDTVFLDWYGASGYFGSCMDNGGGAAFVKGTPVREWGSLDLPNAAMDVYLNGYYVKSGTGRAAMGHPLTSLTWLLNWLRERGRHIEAGEFVSTGTCTGHLFALPGDTVMADFGDLGRVEAKFLP
jgi:2-keto-4-pentenoate hydratase